LTYGSLVDELQLLVAGWAKKKEERAAKWMTALVQQDIDDLDDLKLRAKSNVAWQALLKELVDNHHGQLVAALEDWKEQWDASRAKPMDVEGLYLLFLFK